MDSEMSGPKARHGTLKACPTSPGLSESLVWDSLLVPYDVSFPGDATKRSRGGPGILAVVRWRLWGPPDLVAQLAAGTQPKSHATCH